MARKENVKARAEAPQENMDRFFEVFERFVEPTIKGNEDLEQMQMLYTAAQMGWNLSLFPPDLRPRMLAELLQEFEPDMRFAMRGYLDILVKRKDEQFAGERWLIQDLQLDLIDDDLAISMSVQEVEERVEA